MALNRKDIERLRVILNGMTPETKAKLTGADRMKHALDMMDYCQPGELDSCINRFNRTFK